MRNVAGGVADTNNNLNMTMDATRQEMAAANQTLSDGVNMVDGHLSNVTPAAEELMSGMSELLERVSEPLALVATLIGPLQILHGVNIVLTILTTLNIIKGPTQRLQQTAKEIKVELEKLTDAVKGVRDELHAGNVVHMARNITGGKSFQLEGTKIKSYAFYSSNTACVSQLKGSNFCAFSSVRDLLKFIQEFSELGKVAKIVSKESLGKQIEVHLKVFFLTQIQINLFKSHTITSLEIVSSSLVIRVTNGLLYSNDCLLIKAPKCV